MPVNSVQADMILIFFAIAPYARTHTHTHTPDIQMALINIW